MDKLYIKNAPMQAPGLVISGTTTLAKNGNTFLYKVNDLVYSLAANAVFPTMAGITIAPGMQAVITVYVDADGVITYDKSVEVSAGAAFPWSKVKLNNELKAVMGYIILANNSCSIWTGGTDDLSDIDDTYVDEYGFYGV